MASAQMESDLRKKGVKCGAKAGKAAGLLIAIRDFGCEVL